MSKPVDEPNLFNSLEWYMIFNIEKNTRDMYMSKRVFNTFNMKYY